MKNNKNWLIGGLLAAIVVMAVGYAALSQELEIFGTAQIDADWNVEITSITEMTAVEATTFSTSHDGTAATFVVDLHEPGASASYDIVIENSGTIDAIVDSISISETELVDNVSFVFTGILANDTLATAATHTGTVTVEWDILAEVFPEELTEEFTVTINYVQD